MGKTRSILQSAAAFIIVILIILIFQGTGLLSDFLWFDALNFSDIFLISLQSKIFVFLASALLFFIFAAVNLWISNKLSKDKNIIPSKFKFAIIFLLSIFVGLINYPKWFIIQQYIQQVPFNVKDPIFLKDVAFYVFSLPFFHAVWNFLMLTLVLTIIIALLNYLQSVLITFRPQRQEPGPEQPLPQSFSFKKEWSRLRRGATNHLAALGSLFFILLAVRHYLQRYTIMYSEQGIVVGAGYTDVVIYLPVIKIMMMLAGLLAVIFLFWIFFISKSPKLKKRHVLLYLIIVYFLVGFFGTIIIPGIVQSLKVSPNEINLEKEYIENNIRFTKTAYGLDNIEEVDFNVEMGLTPEIIDNASETINNVRLLDWRPLTKTYQQTQEIRLYYDLSGIDIDRYEINNKLTEVMLAPRELDQSKITENAQTWVNLHMIYTHGFGVVMSPVNKVTSQGLPDYFIKDIPPVNTIGDESIDIKRPEIYYGEKENNFILVNTKTNEFNYPKGNKNVYNNYDGRGGVLLDKFWKNLIMALRFMDIKILLSSDITPESRIMFIRNIQERISKITPFFELDNDPYLVINNGRLYWIQDAYTTTGHYPYSEKSGPINYVRNSVKIVMDAYDGDITYYIIDRKDPIVKTYSRIFPGQFKSISEMPKGLIRHIRYPEDLFRIQTRIYNTYHMEDPTVFYNKEDAWQVSKEIYGIGQQVEVDPYYIIMKLPGKTKEEFVLMNPFTPIKKDNMIAWMAARSDGRHYGKLILYKFQKDKLVYGPSQIEAKIDQDSEISQQLTLWSQQGSQVTRGNLLVIPIEDSILYVEPLYIQAESGQLPQLKQVIVSDGDKVVMEETLGAALEVLFGKTSSQEDKDNAERSNDELIAQANIYYEEIQQSMKEGNWTSIGNNFERLGSVLNALTD